MPVQCPLGGLQATTRTVFGGRGDGEERGCCGLPDLGAPVGGESDSPGICVCEFESTFEMGQSRVSYHMRKLKEAGLVREEKRGRWSFYSLACEEASRLSRLLTGVSEHLGVDWSNGYG